MAFNQILSMENDRNIEEFISFPKLSGSLLNKVDDVAKIGFKQTGKTFVKDMAEEGAEATAKKTGKKTLQGAATYLNKNKKAIAAGVAGVTVGTYVAADQGLLGNNAKQFTDKVEQKVDQTVDKAKQEAEKQIQKAKESAEKNTAELANKMSNSLLGVDLDTAGVILFIAIIIIITMQLGLLKIGLPITAVIGVKHYLKKSKKNTFINPL